MAAVTIPTYFGAQENKICHCFLVLHLFTMKWLGPDVMILVFWMLRALSQLFHSPFSPLSRGSLFPVCFPPLEWVSSVYLRLLIFLPAVLILACYLSSPAFCMMYSACKLNKQVDNIQPWHTPFPMWNQSIVSCLVLTVASWSEIGRASCRERV